MPRDSDSSRHRQLKTIKYGATTSDYNLLDSRIPVPLNVHQQKVGSRLRLNVRGPEGNKVYTLTIGDSRDDKVELPIDVHVLNSYIRTGKVDSNLLMQLLGEFSGI